MPRLAAFVDGKYGVLDSESVKKLAAVGISSAEDLLSLDVDWSVL